VINTLIVIQVLVQFIAQVVAVMLIRRNRRISSVLIRCHCIR